MSTDALFPLPPPDVGRLSKKERKAAYLILRWVLKSDVPPPDGKTISLGYDAMKKLGLYQTMTEISKVQVVDLPRSSRGGWAPKAKSPAAVPPRKDEKAKPSRAAEKVQDSSTCP